MAVAEGQHPEAVAVPGCDVPERERDALGHVCLAPVGRAEGHRDRRVEQDPADEHALGEQRYFNLQCLIYGSNPSRYLTIVTEGDLPEARAKSCPAEARRLDRAWLRLLLPHVAPKYEMTEEKAYRLFEQREKERNRNADAPYVR